MVSPSPRRILVVDDNRDQAESLQLLLRLSGHVVMITHDGASALDAAREFRPDTALIDLGMPGMNGYEVAHNLRQEPAFQPLLLIAQTGWDGDEHRRVSEQAGFDHYLAKPISLEALTEVLAAK